MDAHGKSLIDTLRKSLPPVFPRRLVEEKMGGALKASTLANLDSDAKGPGGTRVGKFILYEKDAFLVWLEQRMEASKNKYPLSRNSTHIDSDLLSPR